MEAGLSEILVKLLESPKILESITKEIMLLRKEVAELKKMQDNQIAEKYHDDWFQAEIAAKMLYMSIRTWRKLKDKGDLEFVRRGKKLYMTRQQIEEYKNKHKIQ